MISIKIEHAPEIGTSCFEVKNYTFKADKNDRSALYLIYIDDSLYMRKYTFQCDMHFKIISRYAKLCSS